MSHRGETDHEDNMDGASPLTALALPPIEEDQRRHQRELESQNEEAFITGLERPEFADELAGSASEAALPPPIESSMISTREHQLSLESMETHTAGADREHSEFATKLYTISYLIFFAIFGALARVGLTALTYYSGAPITTSVTWANVGGCLLMGFFSEDQSLFQEEWGSIHHLQEKNTNSASSSGQSASSHAPQRAGTNEASSAEERKTRHNAIKKTIPLYIGLTTGFCGSFTSFSSFMVDAMLALSNDLPNPNTPSISPRNGGYSFMAVVAVILYTISLSLSSFIFGAHLALVMERFLPTIPFDLMRKFIDRSIVCLAFGCWVGSIFLALWPPDRHNHITEQTWRGRAVFAVVFAPLGCLFRFYVSILLNSRVPTFPLGTFVTNMVGTLVMAMCFDLQHAGSVVASTAWSSGNSSSFHQLIGCQVLKGVMDGFCGCATTVSTWVAELHSLKLKHAYLYGIISVGLALAFLIVTIGSMRWTVGLAEPVC
ncbi:hypothetical protein FQN57_006232 [Myotisia sp. PD_48]|nr:hypothetical protein FQN57_006232 [Myotisia sp. PD_48]